jgi:hypothetical protein
MSKGFGVGFGQVDGTQFQKFADNWPELQTQMSRILNSQQLADANAPATEFAVYQHFILKRNKPIEKRLAKLISTLIKEVALTGQSYRKVIESPEGEKALFSYVDPQSDDDAGYIVVKTPTHLAIMLVSIVR